MSRGFDYDDFHDADDDEYFFDDQGDLLHYDNDGIVRQDNTDNLITFVRQGLENRSSMVSDATIISTLKKKNDDPEAAIEHIIRTILDADLLESMSKSIMDILGPDAKYTTKLAIQDSLYYYYYDEQKTLDYIKKQVLTTKNKDLAEAIKREKALQREAASEVASSIGESTEDGPVKMKGFKKPQSNKLNVIELYNHRASHEKRDCSFVVAGHVDAGKSTLMGRLLLEVGAIDDYSVSKNEAAASKLGKKTFGFAWVMDQREEERERGVTIDIATNHFETEKTKFTILDAPGHKDFVPNMISGASQADFAVLVIDANTNAFERGLKGQTLEHILLLRSLGIQRIVIAVNKLDMVGWSRERYEEIRDQVTAFMLKLSFPKRMISFVPISGLDGTNISKKATHNSSLDWYEGPTLLETLEAIEAPAKVLGRPMRMAISETFNSAFGGLTISGRLQVGTVQVGDELVVASLKSPLCYVKSILVGQEPRDWAVSGEHVDLVVVGIEPEDIQPGDVISISTFPVELSNSFSLKVLAFKPFMADTIDLHRGRKHSAGCVTAIPALLDKASGVAKSFNPSVVSEGAVARVTVVLRNDIAVDPGQRVVIRKDGETIAAGVVE